MSRQCIQLYDYNIWANQRIFTHLQSLPSDLFLKEVDLGFKSIAEIFGHIASVDQVWFARIREMEGPSTIEAKQFNDIEEAIEFITKLQTQIREYLLSVSDCGKAVTYKNTMGQEFQNSISELIQQIVNHGTYHRGNITTILRYLGYKGIQTDYIAFLRI